MKPSTLLVALASFAAGAVLALTAVEGLASPARPAKPSYYADGRHGFSLLPPEFPKGEKDSAGMTVSFFSPPKNGFATNLGVMVQNVAMTADQYSELSTGQFKNAGLKVVSETRKKVGGKDAIAWEYEGTLQERELKWMALAVVDTDRVYLLTGTALKADYDQAAKAFKPCLDSFKLGD